MNLAFDLLHESANARGVGEVAVHGYPLRTFDVLYARPPAFRDRHAGSRPDGGSHVLASMLLKEGDPVTAGNSTEDCNRSRIDRLAPTTNRFSVVNNITRRVVASPIPDLQRDLGESK
jgi:hypothetical protein